jgi:hypothetical protein
MHRRRFLGSLAVAAAALALPRPSRAQAGGVNRFLFVQALGGWDPLCVFAPLFGRPGIDMEAAAEPFTRGDLTLVDHPGRPAVRAFFEAHGDACVVLNGVSVRSVNHETCQAVALTGGTSETGTDWATRLADARRDVYRLPHVVVSGPAFPGERGTIVSRAQGRLQAALDGGVFDEADTPTRGPDFAVTPVVDRYLSRRAAGFAAAAPESRLRAAQVEAVARAQGLVSDRLELSLRGGGSLDARLETALSALSSGLCRCASVATDFIFDTHADNGLQIGLFQEFFAALNTLRARLDATPGPEGRPLSADTLLVVGSEMGRTPAYNATFGRDHWPFTSMMLVGPGLRGGRTVGGYTARYGGIGVDPATGAPDPARPGIAAADLGATLLLAGGVDPAVALPFATPLTGLLA